MVASNELKVEYFHETAKLIFELVVELSEELNIDFEFVNLVRLHKYITSTHPL